MGKYSRSDIGRGGGVSYPGSAVNNAMSMSALTTQERKII